MPWLFVYFPQKYNFLKKVLQPDGFNKNLFLILQKPLLLPQIEFRVKKWIGSIVFVGLILSGCGPDIVFEKTVDLNGLWTYDNIQSFDFEVTDTLPSYDLLLDVKHDKAFGYQNIYTKVKTIFPDQKEVEHVISLNLTDSNNHWVGDCNAENCIAPLILSENIYFKTEGVYKIIIQQNGRTDSLNGIQSLHFTLSKHPDNK